jgi:A/G-specific adenine glycosylase
LQGTVNNLSLFPTEESSIPATPENFSERVLQWFDLHGRKHLPWQEHKTAYRVWVSEIMLQQTQVATVIPYFERFIERFPTAQVLAQASQDDVLQHWSGLGYYARARNLHKAAQQVCRTFDGELPKTVEALSALPGIGRSTAGAILSITHNIWAPILDGNVKRVLARHAGVEGWPGDTKVLQRLWRVAETFTPHARVADYTQAMMDLGAILCTPRQPECLNCPVKASCNAFATGRIATLPGARPKKALPQRHCQLVLIVNEQQNILLERRPEMGIWGGLWSLPQAEEQTAADDIQRHWERCLGASLERQYSLSPVKHTFSHFQLIMTPVVWRARNTGKVMNDGNRLVWHNLDEQPPGLPAPIKKLLRSYPETVQLSLTEQGLAPSAHKTT